mmetsp:Transcript_27253/g.50022  ORF Transcript_27253/g.50022 Transcript_27253/m.50022 type:complete len:476 (-) Transcript_27253:31-1458(-)
MQPPAKRLLRHWADSDGGHNCPQGALGQSECHSKPRQPDTALRELPQDVDLMICELLTPTDVLQLETVNHQLKDPCQSNRLWKVFCTRQWGAKSNFTAYRRAKDLFRDDNGWHPLCERKPVLPKFQMKEISLHATQCMAMDLRFTGEETITAWNIEAMNSSGHKQRQASLSIVDHSTARVKQVFDLCGTAMNCCDVSQGLILTGSVDGKVRTYRRSDSLTDQLYRQSCEYICEDEVNDLRIAREGAAIAIRTTPRRRPAGLDFIPLQRPDRRISFPGGSWATKGKFIHAVDGFEEGCSLGSVACIGENSHNSHYYAMLFDFRLSKPCVVDFQVTSDQQSKEGTMLWPFHAGCFPMVYGNLQPSSQSGSISMIDFRHPAVQELLPFFELPRPVDDFRCYRGQLYTLCTSGITKNLEVYRCSPCTREVECLCHFPQGPAVGGLPGVPVDLKHLGICDAGFAAANGASLTLASIAEPT